MRHDHKTMEELAKTSQKPVTPEQVSCYIDTASDLWLIHNAGRRSAQEDRRLQVPRVLSKDQRRCTRGLRICNPSCPFDPQERRQEEVPNPVNNASSLFVTRAAILSLFYTRIPTIHVELPSVKEKGSSTTFGTSIGSSLSGSDGLFMPCTVPFSSWTRSWTLSRP